ncbi:unnamed protein product, partial [Adineta ricciae]
PNFHRQSDIPNTKSGNLVSSIVKSPSQRQKHIFIESLSQGTLSFHNITYTVSGTLRNFSWKKCCTSCVKTKSDKNILDNVSGLFPSGLNAIMGPSGCGKSTLLDILASRKDMRCLTGEVLIDGLPPSSSYKCMIGYVVQENIICETLTVRENLMFSINIRLQDDLSKVDRISRVTEVIQELGLDSCANTKVGGLLTRGISGGERKRTCIGMELVLSPKILLLDEPTTGLDSTTAREVMQHLHALSQKNRTIIFSIHQPGHFIFKLFDNILLMCNGKSVYHGTPENVLPYFVKQGYFLEQYESPPDFSLDILIKVSRRPNDLKILHNAYMNSSMQADIDKFYKKRKYRHNENSPTSRHRKKAVRSYAAEAFYLLQRTLRNTLRDPALFLSQIIISILLGILMGLIFHDMETTPDIGVRNRLGAIFFIVSSQALCSASAIASAIISMLFVITAMSMFTGFLIDLSSIDVWLSWIQWISAVRYATNTLIINEFDNMEFCLANATQICPVTGADVMNQYKLDFATTWDTWKYLFALVMMTIVPLMLGYLQLLFMKKTK